MDLFKLDFDTSVWLYCSVLAAAVPVLIPAVQFGFVYRLWSAYDRPVDRDHCFCNCWDTAFKAGYETGVGAYKHVYFNITSNTLVIWAVTVAAVVLFYEATRKIFVSLYNGSARPRMCILFLAVIYSHYYAWWCYFNAFNDDYYKQVCHQLLFSTTELVSTACVVHLADAHNYVRPRPVLVIMSVAAFHIAASFWDQFAENVVRGEGQRHQVLRDLGFMAGDLAHLVLPWQELRVVARRRGIPTSHLIKDRDFTVAACSALALWLVSAVIL